MEIGKTIKLTASRSTDNGFYLADKNNNEVLLPKTYVSDDLEIGDLIEVFIYKDSEDRLVATTLKPYIQFEEFAYLQVKDVNKYGAFMDWGLPKDLMVPYAEQIEKMEVGKWYLVFLLEDEDTERLIGTCNVNSFVFYDDIDVKKGDEVDLLLFDRNELGMSAIVNNLYRGLIFETDIHKEIKPGDKIKGFVKQVRDDGKIDLVLEPEGYENSIDKNSNLLLNTLKQNNGFLNLSDKSSPDQIKKILGLSKKAFKKALGNLYKQKKVEITDTGIKIIHE